MAEQVAASGNGKAMVRPLSKWQQQGKGKAAEQAAIVKQW